MNESMIGDFQFAWDNTSLSLLKRCPRKYYYSMIENWNRKHTAAPLSFGSFFHRGLELFDRFRQKGLDYQAACEQMVKQVAIESEMDSIVFDPNTLVETKVKQRYATDDNKRNLYTLLRSLIWYLDHYKNDVFETIVLPNGKPAVELSFRIEMPFKVNDTQILYCGHLDKAVTHGGLAWVLERKHTVRTLGSYYFDQYIMDSQPTGYAFALETLSHRAVGGVIIDAAQVAVGFTRFQRAFANRRPERINEWLENTKEWIQLAADFANANHWPMNETACAVMGKCPYIDVCSAPKNMREQYLNTQFEKRVWDPLKSRGEDE